MILAPVSPRASSRRSLASTGMLALSIWRPSRMVSSVMMTDLGSRDMVAGSWSVCARSVVAASYRVNSRTMRRRLALCCAI